VLFLSQGFGVGARIPAPGTWGAFLGVAWFALLAWPGSYWLFLIGTAAGIAVSVPLCTAAETILRRKDPGSVVVDELAAMPLCFLAWITDRWLADGQIAFPALLVEKNGWLAVTVGFVAFRFFDIAKPWPIRSVQTLPGGWGVICDDVLAAIGAAVVVLLVMRTF
jgi:phosphatidylglycerophosphatase A